MTAKEQNKLAGIFLMAHGGLQAFVMLIIGLIYGGIGIAMLSTSQKEDEQFAGVIILAVMAFVFVVSLVFVIPQIVGGWKMLKERPNARIWGIIGSIVSCLSFPLGTAAGVFGLVFLFGENGKQFYLGGANYPSFNAPAPPPPSSWQ